MEDPIIISIASLLWFAEELIIGKYSSKHRGEKRDRKSLVAIYCGVLLIAIVMNLFIWYKTIGLFPFNTHMMVFVGVAVMAIGGLLRAIAAVTLGRFFTVTVQVQNDHRLIQNGMYRYIRHPSYSGEWLIMFGLGLALNSWFACLLFTLIFAITFGYRMYLEERELCTVFGSEYIRYKKRSWRLVPFIY